MLCSMALPSKLCAALHSQSNVGNVLLQAMQKFGLVSLVAVLSGVDSDYGTGPRRNGSVNLRSTLYPIERMSC